MFLKACKHLIWEQRESQGHGRRAACWRVLASRWIRAPKLRHKPTRTSEDVHWAMATASVSANNQRRTRGARLGFRVEARTKSLVERAARLERRNLTDFCLSARNHAAQQTLDRHGFILSEADRNAFFEALVSPPKPNARLRKALRRELKRLEP